MHGTMADRVRDAVRRYSPEDVEDLEALIILGRRETQFLDRN